MFPWKYSLSEVFEKRIFKLTSITYDQFRRCKHIVPSTGLPPFGDGKRSKTAETHLCTSRWIGYFEAPHWTILIEHTDLMASFPSPVKDPSHQTDWRKFEKLDAMRRPGLTEFEFYGLFVQCDRCKMITTRLVFCYHHEQCIVGPILADQTNDSDSELLTEPDLE